MEGNLEQQGSLTCSWHSSPHYLCEAPFRVLPELRVLNWMQIQRKNLGGGAGGISSEWRGQSLEGVGQGPQSVTRLSPGVRGPEERPRQHRSSRQEPGPQSVRL